MSKLTILAGFGAGYVLGARAGRERYDQLQAAYDKVRNDPRVQSRAQQAADAFKDNAPGVAQGVKDKVEGAAGAAKDKVSRSSDSPTSAESAADGDLNPDRLKLTDETGPQGTLP